MAAALLRRGTYNSQDIKFELEATRAVYEASQSALCMFWVCSVSAHSNFHVSQVVRGGYFTAEILQQIH